jgi:hypothetical protein
MLGNALALLAQEHGTALRNMSAAEARRAQQTSRMVQWCASISKQLLLLHNIGSLGFCNNTSMQLFVKGNGTPFSLTVAGSDTIEDVKMKVAKVAGISAAEQQLI